MLKCNSYTFIHSMNIQALFVSFRGNAVMIRRGGLVFKRGERSCLNLMMKRDN